MVRETGEHCIALILRLAGVAARTLWAALPPSSALGIGVGIADGVEGVGSESHMRRSRVLLVLLADSPSGLTWIGLSQNPLWQTSRVRHSSPSTHL